MVSLFTVATHPGLSVNELAERVGAHRLLQAVMSLSCWDVTKAKEARRQSHS